MLVSSSGHLLTATLGCAIGLLIAAISLFAYRAIVGPRRANEATISLETITTQVRAAGKLVGLEVCAKEIATATKGWSWLPPLIMSPAKVAMIFQFEKQYAVDLSMVTPRDLTDFGGRRYQLILPPIRGQLRLTDVTPYDIQDGKICGLLDVFQMDAVAQGELMKRAQAQAAELFEEADQHFQEEARRSIESQLRALVTLFEAELDIAWQDQLNTIDAAEALPAVGEPAGTPALPTPNSGARSS
ncbi:MAG: DUF4230 domain-containing protein [Planctomycetota bacterium]